MNSITNQSNGPPSQPSQPLLTTDQIQTLARVSQKFLALGIDAKPLPEISVGPIVTAYRFLPFGKTRFAQLESLGNDLAIALGVEDIFIKRLPGESAVAVFVPNPERKLIDFKETIAPLWKQYHDPTLRESEHALRVPLNLGVDYLGNPAIADLSSLPHLLIAGTTGSGKSTLLSSMIAAMIYICSSKDINFVLSDTKGVEFGHFVGAPHLLFEPATNVYQTLERMDWILDEMKRRLELIGKSRLRNIHEYKTTTGRPMPFIVLVIDELADLLSDRRRSEDKGPSIAKIAEGKLSEIVQKSRAAGVYCIAGTQRPSVNIVAGSIKANFPARLSFRQITDADSRTVLGTGGAEHLLSKGDMLFTNPNSPSLLRLHAPYASIVDIDAAVGMAIQRQEL